MGISSSPQVLIVGAGPSGLSAALFFAKTGISVRIIDKNSARSDKSKALGVQAGTLESVDYFLDPQITRDMRAAGLAISSAFIHIENRPPIPADLSHIPSIYNFILILPQNETERIFEEALTKLGVRIERNTELIHFEQDSEGVRAELKTDGVPETVNAKFLLGCDGAHSTTRHQLNISFEGGPYEGDFILGDVKIRGPWANDSIHAFLNDRGGMAVFPMKNGFYRLILIPKFTTPTSETTISIEDFRAIAGKISEGQIEVLESTWLTRFSVHHRIAGSFRQERVFLVGDAAHIHSPAGGQGMNTGMQEAMGLALKIRNVLTGKAPYASLSSYEEERRPIAKSVLRATDFASRLFLTNENTLVRVVRHYIAPHLAGLKPLQRYIFSGVSEVDIAREQIRANPIS